MTKRLPPLGSSFRRRMQERAQERRDYKMTMSEWKLIGRRIEEQPYFQACIRRVLGDAAK